MSNQVEVLTQSEKEEAVSEGVAEWLVKALWRAALWSAAIGLLALLGFTNLWPGAIAVWTIVTVFGFLSHPVAALKNAADAKIARTED